MYSKLTLTIDGLSRAWDGREKTRWAGRMVRKLCVVVFNSDNLYAFEIVLAVAILDVVAIPTAILGPQVVITLITV